MELGGEVFCHPVFSSDVGEGDLYLVEVPDCPRHGEVHGADIDDDALQILDRNAPLAIGYPQKGDYLKASLGGQGEGNPVDVDHPSQDILDSFPVPVPV